jgi:hypothetical protein
MRDLEEPGALLVGQLPAELKLPLNSLDVSFFRVAFSAVNGVHSRMTQAHRDVLQRPTFPSRVQRDRHRRSRSQRSQEQIIRRGSCIGAAKGERLVGNKPVRARFHSLRES